MTRFAVVMAVGVAADACDFTREAPLAVEEERTAVYSVLEAGSDSASVFIVHAPVDTEPGETPFRPVSGAEVRVITPSGETLHLVEVAEVTGCFTPRDGADDEPGDTGCYRTRVPGGVRPGGRYVLEVRLPDGRPVEGEVRVPRSLDLLAPAPDARIGVHPGFDAAGEFEVRLEAPLAVARLELLVQSLREDCRVDLRETGPVIGGTMILAPDRSRVNVPLDDAICEDADGEPVGFDSLPSRLTVVGYDSAYTLYAERVLESEGAVPADEVSIGLTGAFGLFGSAAADERRIVLEPME